MGCSIGRKNGVVRLVSINCEICNKEFNVFPYEIKTRHRVTCSKKCSKEYQKINLHGSYAKGHKKSGGFSKGDKHKEETIIKMSLLKIGKTTWMKGKSHSKETRIKLSISGKGRKAWNKGIKGLFIKEKHWNWKGGKSFEPYGKEFDSNLRETIRMKYGYKCFECGVSQLEIGRKLSVHHIDYNKNNNSFDNLISLCVKCHGKTCATKSIDKWVAYYQNKVNSSVMEALE